MIQPQGGIGFQFHKGTIKAVEGSVPTTLYCSFNSIKVQLRQKACIEAADDFNFQFHKGTIKAHFSYSSCYCSELSIP